MLKNFGQKFVDAHKRLGQKIIAFANRLGIGSPEAVASARQAAENQKYEDFFNSADYRIDQRIQEEAVEREMSLLDAQNVFNAEQAQIARDHQKELASSAYQTAVADMQRAGINPLLAYSQGGATYPSVSSASSASANLDTSLLADLVKTQEANSAMVTSALLQMLGTVIGSIGGQAVRGSMK